MSAYGINPAESGMMIGTNPPTEECGQTLRKSPGGENGVLQMQNQTDIETAYRSHKPSALEPTLAQDNGVKCYDPYNNTESEATPTIRSNAGVSTAGPLAYGADLSQMRYIVRRLTPTECERLMGLPSGYTIPRGLRTTDELVAEFQRIFDTYYEIMASYSKKPTPKHRSANQVRAWLEKITDPATCPDSPRYKACGNGWATNQPRWILTRLIAIGEGIDPFTGKSYATDK